MTAKRGLSDNQATIIALIFAVLFSVQASLEGLPDDQKPPSYIMTILAIAASAAIVAKAQLGVRDATTAQVARRADGELRQKREVPQSQLPPKPP